MVDVLTKADDKAKRAKNDSYTKSLLAHVRKYGAEEAAHLEIALMELALVSLDELRDDIEKAVPGSLSMKKASRETDVKKFTRALAKVAFETGNYNKAIEFHKRFVEVGKATVTIPEYKREDGTVVAEHERKLPEGHSAKARAERAEIQREVEEASASATNRDGGRFRSKDKVREMIRDASLKLSAAEQRAAQGRAEAKQESDQWRTKTGPTAKDAMSGVASSAQSGAIREFLEGNSLGQGILNVAGFIGRTGGTLAFAARAIYEYGPRVGLEMAKNYYRYGGYEVRMRINDKGETVTEFGDVVPMEAGQDAMREWAIQTLSSRLPSAASHSAGAMPPSEGFIINADGKILGHGVGRGKDHFLPFNSRQLRAMRKEEGVEFVRRRMYGGPTTEDLHAAMMMGADRLTVVSRGGTFTLDVSQRGHGLKLEHVQVLRRFEEVLANKGRDFDGYRKAMETLQAEFPLHFHVGEGAVQRGDGNWPELQDRILPMQSLSNSLREALGITLGEETKEERDSRIFAPETTATTTPGGAIPTRNTQDAQAMGEKVKQALDGRSMKDYVDHMVNVQGKTYQQATQSLVSRVGNAGVPMPSNHWAVRISQGRDPDTGEKREQRTTPGGQSSSQQKATPVLPPEMRRPGGNTAYDPTGSTQMPASSAVSGTVDWSSHESGRQILSDLGVDPDAYSNPEKADRALSQLETSASRWQKAAEEGPGSYEWNRMTDILEGGGWDVDWMREHNRKFGH